MQLDEVPGAPSLEPLDQVHLPQRSGAVDRPGHQRANGFVELLVASRWGDRHGPDVEPDVEVLGVDPRRPGQSERWNGQALAEYQVKQMAEQARVEDPTPDENWKWLPAFLGLPVELDSTALKCRPWATWALAALIALISVAAFFHLDEAVHRFGLIPAQPWRYGGFTWISSFFLHGGLWHLLGNLYFLLLVGDNVEDYMGRWRYILLVGLATVGGDALHTMVAAHSTEPSIGASGGISGLLAFYALEFPRARLGFLLRYFWQFSWIQMPAWAAFALWIMLQIFGVYTQLAGFSHVSALAHLGGVGVGMVFWLIWGRKARQE